MGCGAAEATVLGFVCFVVINPRVLLFIFLFHKFSYLTSFVLHPPPPIGSTVPVAGSHYVLNPSGDLTSTAKTIQPVIDELKWTGVTGSA